MRRIRVHREGLRDPETLVRPAPIASRRLVRAATLVHQSAFAYFLKRVIDTLAAALSVCRLHKASLHRGIRLTVNFINPGAM
jgi:hypothetical protein